MTERTIDYPSLVLGALREAVARVIREAAEEGLPGEHHFYITFRTTDEGVVVPPSLRSQYPEELTIVLQHQFWNLAADADGFSVTLRFSGRETDVRVPFSAITAFADPSVEFGVQLAPPEAAPEGDAEADDGEVRPESTSDEDPGPDESSGDGTVISFDRHRRRD